MLNSNYTNFFLKRYYKYFIVICLIIFCLIFIYNYKNYHFKTNNLTRNIKDAIYVGNGVVINNQTVLVNKDLIDENCIGKYSGIMGKIFAIDKSQTLPMIIIAKNNILNTYVLSTKRYEDKFKVYSLFDFDKTDKNYKVGNEVLIPLTLNKNGYFNFKKTKIINTYNTNFTIPLKNQKNNKEKLGLPVFNNKLVLLGNIKGNNDNLYNLNKTDVALTRSNINKNYYVNKDEQLKLFLENNKIPYFMIANNFNLKKSKYKIEDSIVNIICIKRY